MDKKTFLEELRSSLSVLQETELNDIMDEYEQHIDMKVKSGLTEEEAIAEFGNRKELTAEILEAYHVRSDYEAGNSEEKKGEAKEKNSLWHRLTQLWDSGRQAVRRQFMRFRAWFFKLLGKQKPLVSQEETPSEKEIEHAESSNGFLYSMGLKASRLWKGMGYFWGRLFIQSARMAHWCCKNLWTAALWCTRAGWNVFWIFFALICASFGLFSLFGLGVLAVLLFQGYPLAGAAIGALGVNLSLFSAAGLGLTFLWRRNRNEEEIPDRQEEEDRQYA